MVFMVAFVFRLRWSGGKRGVLGLLSIEGGIPLDQGSLVFRYHSLAVYAPSNM